MFHMPFEWEFWHEPVWKQDEWLMASLCSVNDTLRVNRDTLSVSVLPTFLPLYRMGPPSRPLWPPVWTRWWVWPWPGPRRTLSLCAPTTTSRTSSTSTTTGVTSMGISTTLRWTPSSSTAPSISWRRFSDSLTTPASTTQPSPSTL